MRVSTPRLPPLERQPFVLGSGFVLSSSGDRTHRCGDPLCQRVLFLAFIPSLSCCFAFSPHCLLARPLLTRSQQFNSSLLPVRTTPSPARKIAALSRS